MLHLGSGVNQHLLHDTHEAVLNVVRTSVIDFLRAVHLWANVQTAEEGKCFIFMLKFSEFQVEPSACMCVMYIIVCKGIFRQQEAIQTSFVKFNRECLMFFLFFLLYIFRFSNKMLHIGSKLQINCPEFLFLFKYFWQFQLLLKIGCC